MKTLLTFILVCFFLNFTFAQGCESDFPLTHEDNLLRFDKGNWTSGDESFNIKVYAHIVITSMGQEVFTEPNVELAISNLNETFGVSGVQNFGNNTKIQFNLDPCIDYIETDEDYRTIDINEKNDGLDIYFYPTDPSNSSDPNDPDDVWGGRAPFGSTRIGIIGRFLGTGGEPLALTNALAHEVGHIFGLYHTFENTGKWLCATQTTLPGGNIDPGCGIEDLDEVHPEPVNIFAETSADLYIRSKTGDYIADTPADPFLNFSANLPSEYSCTPDPGGDIPDDVDQYEHCNRSTDCKDHNGTQYEFSGFENTMFQSNIMSYAHTNCLILFSQDQIAYMRHNLRGGMTHLLPLHQASPDYSSITNYVKIDCSYPIDYNIIIESGGVLELTKTLYFTKGHGITVKSGGELIINGGKLTKDLCSDELWNGVLVHKNANVTLDNSKIEYAIAGIDYDYVHFSFPITYSPFQFNVVEFSQCDVGIKTRAKFSSIFFAPDNTLNQLHIHNCGIGIDAERTEELVITNSTFENNIDIGLKLSDGSMRVESSNFLDNPIAISYNNMGGSVNSSIIGGSSNNNNIFFQNDQGIVANSPFSNGDFVISHNTFLSNFFGVNITGLSRSIISNNDFFEGIFASGFSASGYLGNHVRDNSIAFNVAGVASESVNLGLEFSTNCFVGNAQGDIFVSGSIKNLQGDVDFANANKFSKIPNVNTFRLNFADDFSYYVLDGLPTSDDKYPTGIDDFIEDSNGEKPNNNCGSLVNPFPIFHFRTCICSETASENEAKIAELEDAIEDLISGDIAANPIYKNILISKYMDCIEALEDCDDESSDFNVFGISPDGKDRKDTYDSRSYPLARVKTMSLLISRGKLAEARTYLNDHVEEFDIYHSDKFESLMNIYLDHIENRYLASGHRSTLESIAEEDHEYKGFALSMLCRYYNDCRSAEFNLDGNNPRVVKGEEDVLFIVYPNPAASSVTIETSETLELSFYSLGRIVEKQSLSKGKHNVDISHFSPGIYFCKAYSSVRDQIYTQKLVKF